MRRIVRKRGEGVNRELGGVWTEGACEAAEAERGLRAKGQFWRERLTADEI